jgi:hypothetical protein
MFKISYAVIFALFCACAGCSSSPKELPVAKPAHGGTMVPLPGERGFAEIVIDAPPAQKRADKAEVKQRIVAYFFEPDGTTAMSAGPSDVKLRIGTGENGRVVNLAPEPKEAGKYVSEAGAYPDGFSGQLEATLGGEAVQVPVQVR